MRVWVGVCLTASLLLAASASAPAQQQSQQQLRIGLLSTFSGPTGILGRHMYDGFMLGVDHAGGKLGGLETSVQKGDDQFKPEVGLKVASEMVQRDKVDFVTGFVFSNVLLAAVKPIIDSKTFVISTTAGPADLAGAKCSPYVFSTAPENDMNDEGAGLYATRAGYKRVYLMAPNYIAGRDALASFKLEFKGEIAGEVYTPLDHLDYAADLAQMASSKPDAAYVFFPGGFGINFIKQFYQAGLRGKIPLLSKATIDTTNLAAQGEAAVGSLEVSHWGPDLDNPANKKFVADFVKKYGYVPSPYAENSYDSAQLIDSAVRAVKGNLSDKDALRKALERGDIRSPRGPFKLNVNHFPIHNLYLIEAVKQSDGRIVHVTKETLIEGKSDRFASQCKMP